MQKAKNILFIMCDQLRWDYLSCYGHPTLQTPNIDRLAKRGVRFDSAYVQSPVCGPSRAAFYTGRSVFSNGVNGNQVPVPLGELMVGDYMRPLGLRTALVGKTHIRIDNEGLNRLAIDENSPIGQQLAESAFEAFERDDGLHPTPLLRNRPDTLHYNSWLNKLGYEGENPWESWANSAEDEAGNILSGWLLRNSNRPARVKDEHSETAYMTNRAIDFMDQAGEEPWLLHLSYIKPHWPYIVSAPYHKQYGLEDFLPVQRAQSEREDAHPVYQAFMNTTVSKTFSRDEVRETVLPGYMGLIAQLDHHLGRLFEYLEKSGRMNDTFIVFTSDHGDYMGDHWMGEKEMFHEASVRIPLIIYDPSEQADATRGHVEKRLVEAIDLLPTFIDRIAGKVDAVALEGHSLLPLLHGIQPTQWRETVFSEIDYAFYEVREELDVGVADARAYMIRSKDWKYIYFKGFPAQLFDLKNDPDEFHDLGGSEAHATIRAEMKEKLFDRLISRKSCTTLTADEISDVRAGEQHTGLCIGKW